jgi:hypothetical protein
MISSKLILVPVNNRLMLKYLRLKERQWERLPRGTSQIGIPDLYMIAICISTELATRQGQLLDLTLKVHAEPAQQDQPRYPATIPMVLHAQLSQKAKTYHTQVVLHGIATNTLGLVASDQTVKIIIMPRQLEVEPLIAHILLLGLTT